jgi:ribosomal-protein-alanine N-acetyltransferase
MQSANYPDYLTQESFSIDRMSEHDLNRVVYLEETCGLSRWGWDAYYRELSSPEATMLVARSSTSPDNEIIGYVAARVVSDEFHINNIAVEPSFRGRRIGQSLLTCALQEGKSMGALYSLLEVRDSNILARRLYEKCGFREAGKRRNYYTNPAEDAVIMKLLI